MWLISVLRYLDRKSILVCLIKASLYPPYACLLLIDKAIVVLLCNFDIMLDVQIHFVSAVACSLLWNHDKRTHAL